MILDPPVSSRSDKELFNMVSHVKKWSEQAKDEAYKELLTRHSENVIAEKIKRNKELLASHKIKVENERAENKSKGYDPLEAIGILLFFPFTLAIPGNLLRPYWYLDKYNYKRKIRQRIVLSIMSIILWFTVFGMLI